MQNQKLLWLLVVDIFKINIVWWYRVYLLMCVIDNSDIQFKKEFAELLNGCTADEYILLW